MQKFIVKPGGKITGEVRVPGDKSISHRSIMFGSLAEGVTHISGFLEGEDALRTLACFRAMGVEIEGPNQGAVKIHGVGLYGLQAPRSAIDLGNSGTSMRLLSGLLAGQSFQSVLKGDESLSKRPMRRVTDPLTQMGARFELTEAGTPPVHIFPAAQGLSSIDYVMPVASAQVKSSLLLAGLYVDGVTRVKEPAPTRDHTERMLRAFGWDLAVNGEWLELKGQQKLTARDIQVPADISSAAFFMVAAAIADASEVLLMDVGTNPTRDGVISILKLMGADISIENERQFGGEPVADIRVRGSQLHGIDIPEKYVPLAIDEFPALFIAAACAQGQTRLTGAEELRVKESDRIAAMENVLHTFGIDATATEDGMCIQGGEIKGGCVNSLGDHRIAMAAAIAGLRASEPIEVLDSANVNTSFPGFAELAKHAGLQIRVL